MGRAFASLIAVAGLFLSVPAAAACGDEIADLEGRLQQVEASAGETSASGSAPDKEQVEVTAEQGEVEVEAEEGGSEPAEDWFGAAPSLDAAREQLENARAMAEEGNEDGCTSHVNQAREIIEQLES